MRYYTVGQSLLKFLKGNPEAFSNTFELNKFVDRYCSDSHIDGNPFQNCGDFKATSWEWKRRLQYEGRLVPQARMMAQSRMISSCLRANRPG